MSTPLHRDEMEHEGFATGDALVRGLLGVSITLLVLSQTWRLFDFSTLWWLRPLDGILRSGRTADTMLVAVVGFLAAREMIRRRRESVTAYMPGRVVAVLVAEGETVRAGQGVVVLEAMKMENAIAAPFAGRVETVGCAVGDLVAKGAVLAEVVR